MPYGHDMNPMLLVEQGHIVVVRDGEGNKVGFGSFEEFLSCSGLDLTGKTYLDYEPDRGLFRDDAAGIKIVTGGVEIAQEDRVPEYDAVIAQAAALAAKKDDPFFGKTLEEARLIKVDQVKAEATALINIKWPEHKQRNVGLGLYPEIRDQMATDIQAVIAAVDDAETAIAVAQDVEAVKAVAPEWPEGI